MRTADPKAVAGKYAKVHAAVEKLFAEAEGRVPASQDTAFDLAVASLRANGIEPDNIQNMDREDRDAAQEMILQKVGVWSFEELEEAFEATPCSAKLKAVSAALGLLGGSKRKPTLAHCLDLFLEDRARGKDQTRKRDG